MAEIRDRDPANGGVLELLETFLDLFLELLPVALGPIGSQAEPLWLRASELFGSFAAQRGLAAGEVIEEFQVLRDVLIRTLWADSPAEIDDRITLREVLRLNRVLNRGVTQSSVGHTDALFFALFQGSGVPEHLTAEARDEIRAQIDSIRSELEALREPVAEG